MALFNKSANEKRRRAGRRVDPETYTADGTPVYPRRRFTVRKSKRIWTELFQGGRFMCCMN